jgi:hypothetical protein
VLFVCLLTGGDKCQRGFGIAFGLFWNGKLSATVVRVLELGCATSVWWRGCSKLGKK